VRARALLDQVTQIEQELGDTRSHPWRRYELGRLEIAEGLHAAAGDHLRASVRAFDAGAFSDGRPGMLRSILALGCLAAAQGRWRRAARLFGAESALRESQSVPPFADWSDEHSARIAAVRAALGDEAFTAAWSHGRAMTWEKAIEEALADE